jgi:hypothetical protein
MTDSEILEQFKMIADSIASVEERLSKNIQASEVRTKILIENEVTKRIDTLFDGYKLTHEKQWELEHKTNTLQQQIGDLQARLVNLENKTA